MSKRLIMILSIALISSTVMTTPVNALKSEKISIDADEVDIDADEVYITSEETEVEAEEVTNFGHYTTIQGEQLTIHNYDDDELLRGTIIRSLNNGIPDSLFRPRLAELDMLPAIVLKVLNLAAVYDGEFDLNYTTTEVLQHSRELEVLGSDILLRKEDYNRNTKKYTYSIMSESVTHIDAIMALYKSLDTSMYHYDFYPIPIEEEIDLGLTPFVELTGDMDAFVGKENYYTDVFVTRTMPEKYWKEATKDGLTMNLSKTGTTTIGEFAIMVQSLLEIKGEPILLPSEENYLLSVHGRELPYGASKKELYAIKYLLARGIINEVESVDDILKPEYMLTILMRAKDVNSRLTLKVVDYPYIPELLDLGFYKTELKDVDLGIEDVVITPNPSTISYFDYYIKKTPLTTFYSKEGVQSIGLYISNVFGTTSGEPLEGSVYLGVEDGYMHFQIPRVIQSTTAMQGNYMTVNSTNDSDTPYNYTIEYGGGIYDEPTLKVPKKSSTTNKYYVDISDSVAMSLTLPEGYSIAGKSGNYYKIEGPEDTILKLMDGLYLDGGYGYYETNKALLSFKRLPFTSEDLYDEHAIKRMTEAFEAKTYLAYTERTSVVEFYTENIESLYWDGKPIQETLGDKLKDLGGNVWEMHIIAENPYQEIVSLLTTTKTSEGIEFPTYVKNDEHILVPFSYLRSKGLIHEVATLVKNKKYVLYSDRRNILIDLDKRLVVSGTSVTELPKIDTSPIIIADPQSGEYYIDYRAIVGMSRDYLLVKDSNGKVSISVVTDGERIATKSLAMRWKPVHTVLGEPITQFISANDNYLSLEDSYTLSNYLLYRKRQGAVNDDYLLVFKPRSLGTVISSNKEATLSRIFGLKLGEREDVDIYSLTPGIVTGNPDILTLNTDSIVRDKYGYKYKIPEITSFDYSDYIEGGQKNPIPIVKAEDRTLINFNLNILEGSEPVTYPLSLINDYLVKSMKLTDGDSLGPITISGNKIQTLSMLPAPVGVHDRYFLYTPKLVKELSDNKAHPYFGTFPTSINIIAETYTDKGTVYQLKYNDIQVSYGYGNVMEFSEIFRGVTNSVYAFNSNGIIGLSDESSYLVEEPDAEPELYIAEENYVIQDTDKKYQNSLMRRISEAIMVTYYILVTVVPKIVVMWFILYGTLALQADLKWVQKFCDNYIDIYKIITLNRQSVYSVDKIKAWVSIIAGGSLLVIVELNRIAAWITALLDFLSKIAR